MKEVPTRKMVVEALRQYRYEAGLDAQTASKAIGKKAGTLYKYESGRIAISQRDLVRLLLLYETDLDKAFMEGPRGGRTRKKDLDAKRRREMLQLFDELPEKGKEKGIEVLRWLKAYYS